MEQPRSLGTGWAGTSANLPQEQTYGKGGPASQVGLRSERELGGYCLIPDWCWGDREKVADPGGRLGAKSPSSIPGLKKLSKKILIWQGHRRSLSLALEKQSRLHSPKNTTWKYSVEKGFCGQICLGNTIDQHTYTHPISGLFIVSLLKALKSLAINK